MEELPGQGTAGEGLVRKGCCPRTLLPGPLQASRDPSPLAGKMSPQGRGAPAKAFISHTHLATDVQADAEVSPEGQLHHSHQIREVQAIWKDGQRAPEGPAPGRVCPALPAQPGTLY